MRREKRLICLFLLLLVVAALVAACGKKGPLVTKIKVEDEDTGVPMELRLYPPHRQPADALGVGDAFNAVNPPAITERDLEPTPAAAATPTPTPPPAEEEP